MDIDAIVRRFELNGEVFRALASGVRDEQARWKPSPNDWSILEVINHLYDEEREDFRVRLDMILYRPGEAWPPIDPQGWVVERQYNVRDLRQSLNRFLEERAHSISWLHNLEHPNWESRSTLPSGHVFSAGDMRASWLAHDFLHIRQLNELHYLYHARQAEPYRIDYAGEW